MAHALRSLTLALFVVAGAAAQGARDLVTLRFAVFGPSEIRELSFQPQPGAPAVALVPSPTARSPRYSYRGGPSIRFSGTQDGKVVAQAVIPTGLSDVLLLFLPRAEVAKAGPAYEVVVLDDSVGALGVGALAIVNLSGLPLSGTLGNQALTLRDGWNAAGSVSRGARIVLSTKVNGREFVAYEGGLSLRPGERALLILQPPFYAGSPQVRATLLVDQPSTSRKPRS